MLRIGQVSKAEGVSPDTLRFYERIQLMPRVERRHGGIRFYSEADISRLRFIRRAKKMGFSLDEIGQLLSFRETPQQARPQIRELACQKLAEVENHLKELVRLRDELTTLTGLCGNTTTTCPILARLDEAQSENAS